jgi:CRP/FNR family cyclic AMP-dependent transcriptional regulator
MISPEVLRRYPCFAGLSDQILKSIAQLAEEKSIPAGARVFNEGEPARFLYVITKGEVNIQYRLGSDELRTVDTLVAGDLLVWSALIEPYKTTALGTATKETGLVAIAADRLRQLCEEDPMLGYRLTTQVAKLLAHRLEGARIQLAATG